MTNQMVSFEVNGKPVTTMVAGGRNLLSLLRDELRLTGAKDGCSQGDCGACTVILDGEAVRACLVRLSTLAGKRVQTIEGLSPEGHLHPLQQAFIDQGALQCGFCAPGLIMSAKALIDKDHDPSPDAIKAALMPNVCRCGTYPRVIEAVRQAAKAMAAGRGPVPVSGYGGPMIGGLVPDIDGVLKVTGRLQFGDDVVMEGMLHGKIVWSEYPHAELVSVDTSRAEQLAGVVAVLTAKDVPGRNRFGGIVPDQPVMCDTKVRFVGDVIAVVFAETADIASEGRDAVEVEYRLLPVVSSPEEALLPGAPLVHEGGNLLRAPVVKAGDVAEGFAQSDVIIEGTYTTPALDHAYIEPETGIGVCDDDGKVTIYSPNQAIFESRAQIAASLGCGEEDVRYISYPLGGGFGGKSGITMQILLALGALRTRRPVKITFTRLESLRMHHKRHAFQLKYRTGATKDGRLMAVQAELLADTGAYANNGPGVIEQACIFAIGPYVVPNIEIQGRSLYTNNVPAGAFRGFGINQPAFAMESQLDILSRKLGIDPIELRLRNALDVGCSTATGETLRHSVGIKETLRRTRIALDNLPQFTPAQGKKIGTGVASGFKNVGAGRGRVDDAGAIVELTKQGDVRARLLAIDMGQGARTAMTQIIAEASGMDLERVQLINADTDLVPRAGAAVGERQTFINGNAALYATRLFKENLLKYVADRLNADVGNLNVRNSNVVDTSDGRVLITMNELAQLAVREGEVIRAEYRYTSPQTFSLYDEETQLLVSREEYKNYPTYAYVTQAAVVEVDEKSGRVRVLKVIAAHDVGVAINPQKIEGQLEGSCIMAMGYALTEEFKQDKGRLVTRRLKQCGVPEIKDTPEIQVIIIEDEEPNGPYGAKGISEVATVPLAPAIANAIYDAIGQRITDLPANPARVLAALRLGSGVEP